MNFYTIAVVFGIAVLFSLAQSTSAGATSGSLLIEDGIVCPKEQTDVSIVVQYPSKTNCGVFYKCNRGIAYRVTCPDGLHYNEHLQACDFPSRAKCQIVNKS